MLDYYGSGAFVDHFPGYQETQRKRCANKREAKLESAWPNAIHFDRKLPICTSMNPSLLLNVFA